MENLRILIEAQLNKKLSEATIKNQIEEIQKSLSKQKIQLDIGINQTNLSQLNSQIDNIQKQINNKLNKPYRGESSVLFSGVEDAIKNYQKLGTVVSKVDIDPKTKQVKSFVIELDKLNGTLKETHKFNSIDFNGKQMFQLDQLKQTDKTLQQINKTQIQAIKDAERYSLIQDKLKEKVNTRLDQSVLGQNYNSLQNRINNISPTTSKTELQAIGHEYQRLIKLQKEYQANERGIDKLISQYNNKIQSLRSGSVGITNQDIINREVHAYQSLIQMLDNLGKTQSRVTEEVKRNLKEEELAIQNRINAQKRVEGSANRYNRDDIHFKQQKMYGDVAGLETRYNHTIDKDKISEVKQRISELNNIPPDKLNKEIKVLEKNIRNIGIEASRVSRQFIPELYAAVGKIASWSLGGGLFFGAIHSAQLLIENIKEIDTRLVELSKVLSNETDYTDLMSKTAQVASDYGRTITETQDSLIEFGKAGFEAAEALKLTDAVLLGKLCPSM